ncbi:MAG: hypothetical protein JKY82_03550 [Rhizobiaceae bacterium]|nr:hypothetical protein [Rhizobiaceae bacterium]MBL4731659.1 hypothetical protein [Rhizobiaceae bacterium]
MNKANNIGMLILATSLTMSGITYSAAQTKDNPTVPTFAEAAMKAMELEKKRKTEKSKKRQLAKPNQPKQSKPTSITIAYQQPYGELVNITEQMARIKIYEATAGECDRITARLPGFCFLRSLNIQNMHRGQTSIRATAQFSILRN